MTSLAARTRQRPPSGCRKARLGDRIEGDAARLHGGNGAAALEAEPRQRRQIGDDDAAGGGRRADGVGDGGVVELAPGGAVRASSGGAAASGAGSAGWIDHAHISWRLFSGS